mmetsp:Transcript_3030/g.4628  ORF Transcript_3030/g.4628 Transcript_3030/m.4628 type:complete len:208 (-) Transcript_3030:93-716(-)
MMEHRPCMRRFVQCENDEPVLFEGETMVMKKDNVELTFEVETPPARGSLFITSRRIVWVSDDAAYDFDVPFITLHAITHDPESFPRPCLYCQLDEEEDGPTEMYLIPAAETELQELFDGFSQAAVLNPDPDCDEDDDQGLIYNVDEVELGAEQAARLAHLESVFRLPGEPGCPLPGDGSNGQFDDADEGAMEQEPDDSISENPPNGA